MAEPARQFAEPLGQAGHTLVWAGSDTGLAKVVADSAREAGCRLLGVSAETLKEAARDDADEMVIARTLSERQGLMLALADSVAIMAGGLEILYEATEIIELRRHATPRKPVVLLNSAGFYDGLERQLHRMERDGFLSEPLDRLVRVTSEVSLCGGFFGPQCDAKYREISERAMSGGAASAIRRQAV